MPILSNSPNHFLATLSPTDADLLRSHVKPLHLPQGTWIYRADDSIERVYFPQTGVISLIVGLTTGQFVEAGMLGRNSVIGAGAALDGQTALNTAVRQPTVLEQLSKRPC